LVAVTRDAGNGGSLYNGMDVAFLYYKSNDGGQSWNIQNYQIPGTDSSYFNGFGPDAYAIDVKDDTVAIVTGIDGKGVQLFKSNDGGINWTKKDVLQSDLWFVESETFVDTTLDGRLYSSDGSVAVLLDNEGKAHVWYGRMYISNPDLTNGGWLYYPGTNGIDYWNEDFPEDAPLYLTGALDIDGNGQLDLIGNVGDVVGLYFLSLASMPQAGIDEDGCIYLSYSAIMENLDNGAQHYRHVYVMRSCDGGCSWSYPIDVTGSGSNSFNECVFPSIARRVDTAVHILYQSDNEPGLAVQGDQDPVGENSMIYLKENTDRFDTTLFCLTGIRGDSLLCSGGTVQLQAIGCASAYSWTGPNSFSSSASTVSVSDVGTYTCSFTTTCGAQEETFTVVNNAGNAMLWYSLLSTQNAICTGDTATLTAVTNVGGLSYLWSANAANATTQSVNVTAPGTYEVTITDCNANDSVLSISLYQPAPPTAFIDGDLSICAGETNQLSVAQVLSSDYIWSTGSTDQTIQVSAAGTYTCTVSNCAGSASAMVTVATEVAPTAAIDAPELDVCEGGQLSATASGGSGYTWSNGSTSAVLTITQPSESGTFTVTVTNDCGDEDTEEVTLTIHENPAAPSITYDGAQYTSSQTGGGTHQWFVDGTEITSITGNSLPNNQSYSGLQITCIYTDENGCVSPESSAILSTEDVVNAAGITVFPNPNNGRFEVRFGDANGKVEIEVIDVLGKVVYGNNVAATSGMIEVIDLSGFESGVYQLNLNGESINTTHSVVIK